MSPGHAEGTALAQLLRYAAVVGSGYLLAIVFYPLELALGISPYVAFGITFAANGAYNFTLLRALVFPPSGRRVHHDAARFTLVASLSLLVNYAAFSALYETTGLSAAAAQRLAVAIAGPVTFLANRLWSFGAVAPASRSTDS
ncbi:MAG TPA: GtrA family protein [Solirubrobacteraceae bacterium]|jgi:putative flippase GtrA|nr:GtrA family protein [Solirubrobacteraceae bacterium]